MKMGEKDCFKIDTRGICLLCLTPVTSDLHTVSSPQLNISSMLKQFLRYIKVTPGDLFGNPFVSVSGHEVNIQVPMCSLCLKVVEEFGRLYSSYVLIMVEMDNCITSVAQSIKTGNQSSEKTQQFLEQMKPRGLVDMINFTVASNLRKVALEKCAKKLQFYNLESKMQISKRFTCCFKSPNEVKKIQDVHMTDKPTLGAPEKEFKATINEQSKLVSEVSYMEERTSQGDVEQEMDEAEIPFELRERAANRVAMFKVLQGIPPQQAPKTTKPVKCKTCSIKLSSIYSLKRHMKLIHSKSNPNIKDNRFNCRTCSREFCSIISLNHHIKFVHSGKSHSNKVKRVKCKICFRELYQTFNLNRHMRLVHSIKPPCVKCTVCFKNFSTVCNLKRHIISVHSEYKQGSGKQNQGPKDPNPEVETPEDVSIKPTSSEQNVPLPDTHLKKIRKVNGSDNQSPKNVSECSSTISVSSVEANPESNQPIKNHVCSICEKGFSRKDRLTKHMRSHVEEKSYLCLYCPAKFALAVFQQLRSHQRIVHSDPE